MENKVGHFNCKNCSNVSCKLKCLLPDELETIKNHSSTIDMDSGAILTVQNTPPSHIIHVKSGMVKVSAHKTKKREVILNILNEGAFLGINCALNNQLHQFSITTLTPCKLCYIEIEYFKRLLQQNAFFSFQVLSMISAESVTMNKKLQDQYELHLPGKIANALIYFSQHLFGSEHFNLPLSKTDLAKYIGASRERVSRLLNQFAADRIIDMKGTEITINSMDLLIRLSNIG